MSSATATLPASTFGLSSGEGQGQGQAANAFLQGGPLGAAPASSIPPTGAGAAATGTSSGSILPLAVAVATSTDGSSTAQMRRVVEIAMSAVKGAGSTAWTAASQLNASALKNEATKLVNVREYSRPQNGEEAMRRFRANLGFFSNTYSVVFLVMAVLTVLSNPTLFISVAFLVAGWGAFIAYGDRTIKIGTIEFHRSEKLVVLSALTTVVVVFGGLVSNVLWIVFSSASIVTAHAVMREPVVIDALAQLEQEGESIVKRGDIV